MTQLKPATNNQQQTTKTIQIVGSILLVIILASVSISPTVLKIGNFDSNDIFQLLTVIAFVATLQQSAVEVFMSTWRDPEQDKLKANLERYDRELSEEDNSPEEQTRLRRERKEIKLEIKKYKATTRKIVLWLTLLSGILISAVGIRILGNLLDPEQFKELPQYQAIAFNIIDVFLTGSLISGGTEGVYQVVQVFSNFLDKTKDKVRET